MPGRDLLPSLNGSKSYHPKKWTQKHRRCVALSLGGFSNNEIAELLDWTPAKVSITINDPRAEHDRENALAKLADVAETITEKLDEASHDAFAVAKDLLYAEKEETQLKAALAILDRAGFTPIRREIQLNEQVPASPEMLEAMRRTLQETQQIEAQYEKPKRIEAEENEAPVVEEAEYEIVGQMESYMENVVDDE